MCMCVILLQGNSLQSSSGLGAGWFGGSSKKQLSELVAPVRSSNTLYYTILIHYYTYKVISLFFEQFSNNNNTQ